MKADSYNSIYKTLQVAMAMCFIGHGMFGIITKPVWCNYFAVFGIGHDLSYQLMPVVGCIDIALGILTLVYPVRAIPAWLVVWGLFTALLRPLAGEPVAELIERSGNFGAPLALLIMSGTPKNLKGWFTLMVPVQSMTNQEQERLKVCLKVVVFLLLAGHGWLNLLEKKSLLQQYTSVGFAQPRQVAEFIGLAEISFACIVLVKPLRVVLFGLFVWKISTELLYPHFGMIEWIERAGSYGVLLALWFATKENGLKPSKKSNALQLHPFRSFRANSVKYQITKFR